MTAQTKVKLYGFKSRHSINQLMQERKHQPTFDSQQVKPDQPSS